MSSNTQCVSGAMRRFDCRLLSMRNLRGYPEVQLLPINPPSVDHLPPPSDLAQRALSLLPSIVLLRSTRHPHALSSLRRGFGRVLLCSAQPTSFSRLSTLVSPLSSLVFPLSSLHSHLSTLVSPPPTRTAVQCINRIPTRKLLNTSPTYDVPSLLCPDCHGSLPR